MVESVFTRMLMGDVPAELIYEDETSFAILDQKPFADGHTLVIPRDQVDYVFDLNDRLFHHLWSVAKLLAEPLQRVTNANRIGVMIEGFAVPHAHIHLVPMVNDQQLHHGNRDKNYPPERLRDLATRIRAEVQGDARFLISN
jgi:histidine triad (HIT) family protein